MPARRARPGVAGAPGRVDAELRGRQLEDEPAIMDIDVGQLEHVAEEGPGLVGVFGVDDGVGAGDHDETLPRRRPAPLPLLVYFQTRTQSIWVVAGRGVMPGSKALVLIPSAWVRATKNGWLKGSGVTRGAAGSH